MDTDQVAHALEVQIRHSGGGSREFDAEVCVVKKGPQAYKSVSLMTFVNRETGEVRKRELRVQTWGAKSDGPGFDFTETKNSWHCENQEIDALRAFLNDQLQATGIYKVVRGDSDYARLLEQVEAGEIAPSDLVGFVRAASDVPNFVAALAASDDGRLLIQAVELHRRREQLAQLRGLVEDATKNEHDLHRQLKTMGWVFGGRYVGETVRKRLTSEDVLDIPLVRADGSLHVVELKQATIPSLFVEHRSHVIVGSPVHEAVGQAANYLRALDEERHTILNKHGVDCRRSSATVIIGHPKFNSATIDASRTSGALRTYNSHLSRIEVMTYADLIDDAERALTFIANDTHVEHDAQGEGETDQDSPSPPDPEPYPWEDEPPF